MEATDAYFGRVIPNKEYEIVVDPLVSPSDLAWITSMVDYVNGSFVDIKREKVKVFLGTTHTWSLKTLKAANLWVGDPNSAYPCSQGINDAYCAERNIALLVYSDIYAPNSLYRWDVGRRSTPAHELFHTVQYALGGPSIAGASGNQEMKIPRWLNEGSANFFGFYVVEKLGFGTYKEGRVSQLDSSLDYKTPIQLSEYSFSSLNPYGIGQGASEYLIASIGFEKFLNIWKFTNSESSFTLGFKKATGIDVEDFYAKFEAARTSIIPNSLPAPAKTSMPSPTPSPTSSSWKDPLEGTACTVENAAIPNQIYELKCINPSKVIPGSTDNRLIWSQNNPPPGWKPGSSAGTTSSTTPNPSTTSSQASLVNTICEKVGSKIMEGEKVLKCNWMGGAQSKGSWTPLVVRKVSTSASNNYKITPIANQVCDSYGDTFDVPEGYLECRWVNGKKLQWIKINNVKQAFVNKVSPQGIEPCKLKNKDVTVTQGDLRSQGLKVGFPFDNTFKHGVYTKGVNEVLIVGIDFPELRGDGTLKATMAEDKKWMQDWFRYYSNDQSKFNVTTIDNWISAPKSAASYVVTGNDGNSSSSNRFLANASQPFIDLITKEIDLRKFNTVYMMFPDGEIDFDMDLIVRNERFKIKEGEMNLNFFGWGHDNELMETLRWSFYVHETLHDFDIIGHAPGNGWPFGLFTNQSGISLAMNPYEQFLLDWLPENQIYCVDAKDLTTTTVSLSPLEREDRQTKMAMIKLSPTRIIVVESHGIDKWSNFKKGDREFPQSFYSVMAYVVDLNKTAAPPVTADQRSLSNEEYAWAMWQNVEGGKSTDYQQTIGIRPDMYNKVAVLGDSFLIDGIQIKFVGTGDYETIEISKL